MLRLYQVLALILVLLMATACGRRNADYVDQVVATANDARLLQLSLEEYARGHGGRYPPTLQSLAESISSDAKQAELRRILSKYPGVVYDGSAPGFVPASRPAHRYVLRVPTGVRGRDWIHVTPDDVVASPELDAADQ